MYILNFINSEFIPPICKNGILNPGSRIVQQQNFRIFYNFRISDEPLNDKNWNLLCLSIDGNNYLRFNLNGETLLAQKIRNSARKYFSEISTITFGSDLVSTMYGILSWTCIWLERAVSKIRKLETFMMETFSQVLFYTRKIV